MALIFRLVDTWTTARASLWQAPPPQWGTTPPAVGTLDHSPFAIVAATQAPVQGTAWMDGLAGYDCVSIAG